MSYMALSYSDCIAHNSRSILIDQVVIVYSEPCELRSASLYLCLRDNMTTTTRVPIKVF